MYCKRKLAHLAGATFVTMALLVGCGSNATQTDGQASEEVVSTQASTPTIESQTIGLESVGNARELGGYVGADGKTVRRGVLLRSAKLGGLSAEDERHLVDDLNLATVVDFRMTREIEEAADPAIEGVKNVNLKIMDEERLAELSSEMASYIQEGDDLTDTITKRRLAVDVGIISDEMYVDWLSSDVGKAGYTAFFDELKALPEGASLLWHCTQGKDRTGLAAMLILSVLGVDEDTIMADYLLTNDFNADLVAGERQMLEERGFEGDKLELMLTAMDMVREQQMQNALTWIKENYGTPLDYAKQELGVTEVDIQALQAKFLV